MQGSSRRGFLRRGVIAAVGLGALARGMSAAAARAPVAIPESAMLLSRQVERELGGGESVAILRQWEIAFSRSGRGITVAGRQLAARVEAPPPFAGLAGIEERRSTAGMWPILLSETGLILSAGGAVQADAMALAAEEAERLIAEGRFGPDEAARQRAFLGELQEIGGSLLGQWPGDLFFPDGVPVCESGEMVLAGGLAGTFELSWIASPAPGREWLGQGRREIVTRIGRDARRAVETWRMEPA